MKQLTHAHAVGIRNKIVTYGKLLRVKEYTIELALPFGRWLGYHAVTLYLGNTKPKFRNLNILVCLWLVPYLLMAVVGGVTFVAILLWFASGAASLYEGFIDDWEEGIVQIAGRFFAAAIWVVGLISLINYIIW